MHSSSWVGTLACTASTAVASTLLTPSFFAPLLLNPVSRYTCHALHKSFDLPPDQLFDWIEEVPIACGSIGQVHRAQLSEKGAALACCDPGEVVAVKVSMGTSVC